VEFTLKKFLLPKVVTMFCQRRQLTEIMLQKGISADFFSGNAEDFSHFDQEHKDAFSKMVSSVLAEVDKLWPMFPSTDEIDDIRHQKRIIDADLNSTSQRCPSPPPVNNAFQFYGRHPSIHARAPQHEHGSSAAAGEQAQPEDAKEVACAFWVRPWDSVFDRKKNGFGTFFAKEVLALCHCDDTTIGRILGISMRHIAVKKSEMVLLFNSLFVSILLISLAGRYLKSHAAQTQPPAWLWLSAQLPSSSAAVTQPRPTMIPTTCHPAKRPRSCTLSLLTFLAALLAFIFPSSSTQLIRHAHSSFLPRSPTQH
jgi:hypothetical protein